MNNFYDLFAKPEVDRPAGNVTPIDPARATRYAAKALASECENVAAAPEGTRNDALNRAAFSIGQLVAAGHVDHPAAWSALRDAAHAAGLDPGEIDATLRSGLGAGAETPRIVPDLPAVPEPTILTATQPPAGEDAQEEDEVASWRPLDLDDVLDGSYQPQLPTLMPRLDDACLLYPGCIHSFHGESESGKSLVAQAEAARLIADAHDVLFIDFESDRASVVGRLLELGASHQQIRAHFTYVRPEVDPRKFPHERAAVAELLARPYALAVIDGVTEALGIFGASTKDNDEITAFMRVLPRTVARLTGAAVVLVDHVTKDSEGRGRFAIGGQAKMAALDGAAYVVEVTEALGRGRRGMVVLRVAKDRPGGVRAQAGPFRATDRTQEAARIVIDSTGGDSIRVEVRAPLTDEQGAGGFRPTHIMQKASEFIAGCDEPVSKKVLEEALDSRADTVRKALAILVQEHYVKVEQGPRNALLHTSIQPYREASDPASSSYVTTVRDDLVRPRPDLVPDEVKSTSSQHPLRGAGVDEVDGARTTSTSSRSDEVRFDPMKGERTAPAWAVAMSMVGNQRWHAWSDVVTAMTEGSDVLEVTCSNLLHNGVKSGQLERRGEHPDREVRLADSQTVACAKCFRPTPNNLTKGGRCPRCVAANGEQLPLTETTEDDQ